MKELSLNMTEESMSKMMKKLFKKVLRKKIRDAAFNYLKNIAKEHSKALKIQYKSFHIQKYLKDQRFSTEEKMLLFKLRSSMDEVKLNFSSMYNDLTCDICTEGAMQDT